MAAWLQQNGTPVPHFNNAPNNQNVAIQNVVQVQEPIQHELGVPRLVNLRAIVAQLGVSFLDGVHPPRNNLSDNPM